ncbi:MAG: hypothetical protein CL607_22770 [Anaerolineaceae bacterium]|nr:hypothetical protein [Anaerolineaceae bacterium]
MLCAFTDYYAAFLLALQGCRAIYNIFMTVTSSHIKMTVLNTPKHKSKNGSFKMALYSVQKALVAIFYLGYTATSLCWNVVPTWQQDLFSKHFLED